MGIVSESDTRPMSSVFDGCTNCTAKNFKDSQNGNLHLYRHFKYRLEGFDKCLCINSC